MNFGEILRKGEIGPQEKEDGDPAVLRLGVTGESISQQLHGRYFEAMSRGSIFSITYTGFNLIANNYASTNYNGFVLYNPKNSGVLMNLLSVRVVGGSNQDAVYALGLGQLIRGTAVFSSASLLQETSTQIGSQARSKCKAYGASTNSGSPLFPPKITLDTFPTTPTNTNIFSSEGIISCLPDTPLFLVNIMTGAGTIMSNLSATFVWEEIPL